MSPRAAVEHVAVVDGVETHYWEFVASPRARTIVMIHGFRGDHHGLQLFADALSEFRVIIPDLPAFGASEVWEQGVHSIDDYGRWLRAFLAHTTSTDAIVLGHSFGSIVVSNALRGKRSAPIVLVNPISMNALTGPKRIAAGLASLWYSIGAALPISLGDAWLSNPWFVRMMSELLVKSSNPALRRWIHHQHAAYFSLYSDRDSLVGAFRVSTSTTVADFAADVDAPVLLVAAADDDITPVSAQRDVQRKFPRSTLVVLDGVGHLVHYEKPIETADAIRLFLSTTG